MRNTTLLLFISFAVITACGPAAYPKRPIPAKRVAIGDRAPAPWPSLEPWGTLESASIHTDSAHTRIVESEAEQDAGDQEGEDADQDADLNTCPGSLSECPLTGCAVPGNAKSRSNEIKHGDPDREHPAKPMVLPISLFADLQTAADALVPQGAYPPPADREALRNLSIQGQSIGEGALVEVTGYLAAMRPEGPESVNCTIAGVANNDYHLSLVPTSGDDEFHGIVVEMIPQDRPGSWNTKALRKIVANETQVLVVGQLFYDAKHLVNAGPKAKTGQPKRFSLWEVHPVQRFYVCTKSACDPDNADGWQEWN